VNVLSAAEIVRTLLGKRRNGAGLRDVVFISSIWARFGARGHAAYCASKAALDGLMRAMAVELAPAVRVNAVLPGAMATAMAATAMADPEIVARFRQDYPLGLGVPEDVAHAVAFLLSPEARWITGSEFTIDGGRTANMSLK
jgi:NAD(P)-dependent dehydrogenase (short-subunit alcohol dehydrogenase family)